MKYPTEVTNKESLVEFLRKASDFNACDEYGETLLTSLIARNELILAEALILNGADVNAKNAANKTALQVAADYGNEAAINTIVHSYLEENGHNDTKALLNFLHQINSNETIFSALVLSPKLIKLLDGNTLGLDEISEKYKIPKVKLILAEKIFNTFYSDYQLSQTDLNRYLLHVIDDGLVFAGELKYLPTPVIHAQISETNGLVFLGESMHLEHLEYPYSVPTPVIHAKILETRGEEFSRPRPYSRGYRPAITAEDFAMMNTEIANLLEKGADISFSNENGETALMLAAKRSRVEFFDLISPQDFQTRKVGGTKPRKRIDINQKDPSGKSALIHAVSVFTPWTPTLGEYYRVNTASANHHEIVEFLLKNGANPNEEYQGKRAVEIAIDQNNPQVVRVLVAAGAEVSPAEHHTEEIRQAIEDGYKEKFFAKNLAEKIWQFGEIFPFKEMLNFSFPPALERLTERTFNTKECAILANPESEIYKSCLDHLAEKFSEASNSQLPQESQDQTGVNSLQSISFAAVFMKAIHDGSLEEEKPNPNAIKVGEPKPTPMTNPTPKER